jgi:hypothetical protein
MFSNLGVYFEKSTHIFSKIVDVLQEGPEGVKWELGFAHFWVGKWDFMHWDWDSSAKKQ